MIYEYWFASITQVSERKKYLLREQLGTGKHIFYIEETKLRQQRFLNEADISMIRQAQKWTNLEERFEDLKRNSIRFVPHFSETFPKKLREIPSPPYALYVKGELPKEDRKSVAIVGARRCTTYGEKYALEYGEKLARCGVHIISGLARGIDGLGQRGALMGGGQTFSVLGCGVDICYPKEHLGLYHDILEKGGGILSEFVPGTSPLPQNFPKRNRIISGLSDVVLVMEAREKSGSLITADMALEQGRDVYALPGPVDNSLSQGCNHLIRQGAGILLSPEMLLEELQISGGFEMLKTDKNKKVLETTENMVYSRLGLYPRNVSQLIEETSLSANEVMELLVTLELKGYIREVSKNYYVKLKE